MVLRALEQKIEALFEGVFGRAFRAHVQPVELARKLSKEMDDHKSVSVSRVYVPNEYTVYLAPDDREQFEGYENSLLAELEEYLGEHAKRESYALLTPPRVQLETDEDLTVGEFGIATRMVQPRHGHRGAEPAEEAEPGATMIYKPAPLEEVLLVLKIAFLALLYLFIWRIVRPVGRDMRLPQESFILKPAAAAAVGLTVQSGRLVVTQSPHFETGKEFELETAPLTIGRSGQHDLALEGDDVASARHAR